MYCSYTGGAGKYPGGEFSEGVFVHGISGRKIYASGLRGKLLLLCAFTEKRNLERSVAWHAFTPENVSFRKLTLNRSTKPVSVRLEEPVVRALPVNDEERDIEFCKFVQQTLGRDLYSSIQITGRGFSQDWAGQSIKILCYQKRKVFYGNNLFAKGACAAGKEKLEDKALKGISFP